MKQKTILFVLFLNLSFFSAFSQNNTKVGYANIEYILSEMPETPQAQVELKNIITKLSTNRDSLVATFNTKAAEYQKNSATLTENVKKEKEDQLLALQNDLQDFQADVQTAINVKRDELLRPIYKRIGQLIEVVAKEKGYTHIINSKINNNSVLLYAEESTDISKLVISKAKL